MRKQELSKLPSKPMITQLMIINPGVMANILLLILKDGMVRSDTAVGTPDYISPEVRKKL